MLCGVEFGKELPLKHIPPAEKPRVAHPGRQALELPYIVGSRTQQHTVVVHRCGNKRIVGGALSLAVVALDKQTTHPCVPDAAGVAGQINTAGIVPRAAQTGLKDRKLIFAQLRCLVNGNNVVFLTLIPENVAVRRAVAEPYRRPAGKGYALFVLTVASQARDTRRHGQKMVRAQLPERTAMSRHLYRVSAAKPRELAPQRPRLTAAARPAVGNELLPRRKNSA